MPFRFPDEPIVPMAGAQPQGLNLRQAMTQASQLNSQGSLRESEVLLQQILQAQSRRESGCTD